MTLFPIQKYFVFNGEFKPVSEFIPSENEGGIYEVLRIEKGVPLFLEDHLERFYVSANIAGKDVLYSYKEIELLLKQLIDKNKISVGNVLISCKTNLKIFAIPYKYPTGGMYTEGVNCGILRAERENPKAKVFQTSVRQKANELIAEKQFYEVLLVDHFGRITEGSRSNVFFINENQIITSPEDEVLLGITRQKTIQIAKGLGLEIVQKEVFLNTLDTFDAVFLTGTSPKILPIKQIDQCFFNPQNRILMSLTDGYNHLIKEYVKTH